MKIINILLLFTCLTLVFPQAVFPQITVAPGSTSGNLQATKCASFTDGPFGECPTGICSRECERIENTAKAYLAIDTATLGKYSVKSTVYSEFTVSGSTDNTGNILTASLLYDIQWYGAWTNTSILFDNAPHAVISIWFRDLTTGQVTQTLNLHEIDYSSIGSLPVGDAGGDIGLGIDKDNNIGECNIKLVRGHTYRVHLSLLLEATGYANSALTVDYLSLSKGVWWNDLRIKVDPDLTERIAELEIEIQKLRTDLETHTHTYLTGSGVGHNNTEAETSAATLTDDDVLPDGVVSSNQDSMVDTVKTVTNSSELKNNNNDASVIDNPAIDNNDDVNAGGGGGCFIDSLF